MLAKIRRSLQQGGDIGGAPAMIIIGLVVVLVVAFFFWRDYAASNAPSPNYASPGQVLPGGITLTNGKAGQATPPKPSGQ